MSIGTSKFYNRFAFFYPLVDIFLRQQKKLLFNEVNKCPAGKLLEIGVGNGAHLKFYKDHSITGIDNSASMLAAAANNNLKDVLLLQMNGEALLFPNDHFDYVILSHVVAVVDDPQKLLSEACRVLKPRGQLFILNHFTPDNSLKYFDRAFNGAASMFHFKSLFYLSSLRGMDKFILKKEYNIGCMAYFKLLILSKL